MRRTGQRVMRTKSANFGMNPREYAGFGRIQAKKNQLREVGFLTIGGGGGNRLVSRCSRCIARPLGQRQAMLDETLTSPRVDAG